METSSPTIKNDATIPTTNAGSANSKYQEKHFLASVSAECCGSGQTGSDQDCFIVDENIEEQLSSHFQHNSAVNHDEEMEMTFPRSMYGEIGDKDIGSYHSEGTICVLFIIIYLFIYLFVDRFYHTMIVCTCKTKTK